jgi:peptide deformylase
MAILNILHFPDSRLRTKAKPVKEVDDKIRNLIKDMFETMHYAKGIGLAATQVDVHQRIVIMDVSKNENESLCFINPEIISHEGTFYRGEDEGCLSVPETYAEIPRFQKIKVKALNEKGEHFELEVDGSRGEQEALLAVCIQHEIDHLDGKLFIDYLSPLKRQRIKDKLKKQQREKA